MTNLYRNAINIYTDTSSKDIIYAKKKTTKIICSGFVPTINCNIVGYVKPKILIGESVNYGEMTAIDMAVDWCIYIMNTYGNTPRAINIFSDSLTSIQILMKNVIKVEKRIGNKEDPRNISSDLLAKYNQYGRDVDALAKLIVYKVFINRIPLRVFHIKAHSLTSRGKVKQYKQYLQTFVTNNSAIYTDEYLQSLINDIGGYEFAYTNVIFNDIIDNITRTKLFYYFKEIQKYARRPEIVDYIEHSMFPIKFVEDDQGSLQLDNSVSIFPQLN